MCDIFKLYTSISTLTIVGTCLSVKYLILYDKIAEKMPQKIYVTVATSKCSHKFVHTLSVFSRRNTMPQILAIFVKYVEFILFNQELASVL